MKKKILGLIGAIAIITLMVFNTQFTKNANINNNIFNLSSLVMHAYATEESSSTSCYAGGAGSTQCSIDAGIEILGVGITVGCSVTCGTGYYACCNIGCTCIEA